MICALKLQKKHVFQRPFNRYLEKRIFCHFKAHIKHYDDQNVTKSWGTNWSKFFIFESLLKIRKFAKISKNVRNFLTQVPESWTFRCAFRILDDSTCCQYHALKWAVSLEKLFNLLAIKLRSFLKKQEKIIGLKNVS